MKRYAIRTNNSCTHQQSWIDDECGVVELARQANQDTPLESYAGIAWDDENERWERELSHEEALEIALRVNFFGDYLVKPA